MPPRAKKNRLPESIAFGKRVRDLREAKDGTLEQLAEAAGMNALQVGHIERGASDVKLSTIVKLARALGVTASELLRSIR